MKRALRRDLASAAGHARAQARLFESMGAKWTGKAAAPPPAVVPPSPVAPPPSLRQAQGLAENREAAAAPPPPPEPKARESVSPPALRQAQGLEEYREAAAAPSAPGPLAALEKIAKKCEKCVLAKTRANVVFGSGNPEASIVFVGEAPGADEDRQGLPFVGRAGKLLTDIIEKGLRIPRAQVYICNVLKCRPPGNRPPKLEEIVSCKPFLEKQIEIIHPKVICALGTFAAQTLLETTRPISSLRGQNLEWQGIPVVCTFHPAYLLRNPPEKKRCWEDIQRLLPYI